MKLMFTFVLLMSGLGTARGQELRREPSADAKPADTPASGGTVTYYVDVQSGKDDQNGRTPSTALRSIQAAADRVNPGDRVIVRPGVYFEQVRLSRYGQAGRPVLFMAETCEFGRVIITAAAPAIRRGEVPWRLEDESLHLYSIALNHNPARVLYSGTDLLPYSTLDGLKQFMLPDGYPGVEHGFHYAAAEHRLYVRLRSDGKHGPPDPARHVMCVAPENAHGFNGQNVWRPEESVVYIGPTNGPANVILDGFTLETPGAAGVLTAASQIVVRNCWFKGCRFGVFGTGRGDKRPDAVFIENCHYDQAYAFADMLDVIAKWKDTKIAEKHRFFWWQRKLPFPEVKNYETGLPGGVGRNWHIRDNVIEEAFEGMSCWAINKSEGAQIYGNRFHRLIDNGVETENHNRDMRICFNRFEDLFEPFSWQPLDGLPWPGPIYIYRNIVSQSPGLNKLWPTCTPGCFKIGASGKNWEHDAMGAVPISQVASRISKRFVVAPDAGFMAFNNTILFPYGTLLTTPMPVEGREARELVNFRFFNNIFLTGGFHSNTNWRGSLIEFYANLNLDRSPGNPHKGLATGETGVTLTDIQEVKFQDCTNGDYRLAAGSPALGRGITTMGEIDASPDLGAIPAGTAWQLAAGPGAGYADDKLSEFQRLMRYQAEFIRTAGPEPGLWGLYAPDTVRTVMLKIPEGTDPGSAITLLFRTTGEKRADKLLEMKGLFGLTIQEDDSGGRLVWSGGQDATGTLIAAMPAWPMASWQSLMFRWDDKRRLSASLNGKTLSLVGTGGDVVFTGKLTGDLAVMIGRHPIADLALGTRKDWR